jgi:hypothetical protein
MHTALDQHAPADQITRDGKPPFRDLAVGPFDPDELPPYPVILEPAPEKGAKTPPSLAERWGRLSPRRKKWAFGGAVGLVAVATFLTPDALPSPNMRTDPSPPPPPIRETELRPTQHLVAVEPALPSWYVTTVRVGRNTRITPDNIGVLFHTQPGKPVPANAIVNPATVLGKFVRRDLGENTILTPADFSAEPVEEPEVRSVRIVSSAGTTVQTFHRDPTTDNWVEKVPAKTAR